MMNLKEITDRKGRKYLWDECNGHGQFHDLQKIFYPNETAGVLEYVKRMEIREDDIFICTYPKAGK